MKKILSLYLCITVLISGLFIGDVYTIVKAQDANIALGKPCTINRGGSHSASPAVNITDGNPSTMWRSYANNNPATLTCEVTLDLESNSTISKIVMTEYKQKAVNLKINLSDDHSSWTTVYNQNLSSVAGVEHRTTEILLDNLAARFIKVIAEDAAYAFGIYELEVYGEAGEPAGDIGGIGTEVDVPFSKGNFDLYLCIGQSNMVGRAAIEEQDKFSIDRAFLLNSNDKWEKAQPGRLARTPFDKVEGMNRYSTVQTGTTPNGLDPSFYFAKTLSDQNPNKGIGIIANSVGGTSLEKWQKGAGTNYYEEAVKRTLAAMEIGTLKGIIWHQGESNQSTYATYLANLKIMVDNLRADLGVPNVPFIAGQLLPSKSSSFNNMITTISGTIDYSDWVSNVGTTDKGDGTHFDSASQRLLGVRYAEKISNFVYQQCTIGDIVVSGAIVKGSTMKFESLVNNPSTSPVSLSMIAALYSSEDKLLSIKTEKHDFTSNEIREISVSLVIPTSANVDGAKVKVMVWNGLDEIKPLNSVFEMANGQIATQIIKTLAEPSYSSIVYPGTDGNLEYAAYTHRGDIMPDFSYCGYKQGDEPIPSVPVVATLEPLNDGDDTERIQAAIDQVSALTPDSNGIRGALLLKAGLYNIGNTLNINTSGIVLRGEGSGEDGTIILGTGTYTYTLINVEGTGSHQRVNNRRYFTDSYVPIGTRSITVDNASTFSVGDDIMVSLTPNEAWINFIKMDAEGGFLVGDGVEPWVASSYRMLFERIVTNIEGNTVTFDVPMVMSAEDIFGGGDIYKYTWEERIQNVGIENIRFDSVFDPSVTLVYSSINPAIPPMTYYADQNHASKAVNFAKSVLNCWAKDLEILHMTSGISLGGKWITVENCSYVEPVSVITGGERYGFTISGQQNLVRNCFTSEARHGFVTSSRVPGPNVFLNCESVKSYAKSETHHRWATGTLFDNVTDVGTASGLASFNRGPNGTGHGWSGAQTVFWNCTAAYIGVESPPTATNFAIGLGGLVGDEDINYPGVIGYISNMSKWAKKDFKYQGIPFVGEAHFECPTGPVIPASLYTQQLQDRIAN